MKNERTEISAGRIVLAMFAGLTAGGAIVATGVPAIGHIVDLAAFSVVLFWPRRT